MAIGGTLIAGFLIGLLAFRVKRRWCPQCGSTTWPYPTADHESEQQHG